MEKKVILNIIIFDDNTNVIIILNILGEGGSLLYRLSDTIWKT